MVYHGIGGLYYAINGFMMLVTFWFFRILFYDMMLFGTMRDMAVYRQNAWWDLYPKEQHWIIKLLFSLYILMYAL